MKHSRTNATRRTAGGCALLRGLPILATLASLSADGGAQRPELHVGYAHVISAGQGIAGNCFAPSNREVVSGRLTTPLWSRGLSAALTVRRPRGANKESQCASAPLPPNITYVGDDRVSLLSAAYTATDVRIGLQVGPGATSVRLNIGAGNAWRPGTDLPYALAVAQLIVRPAAWLQVALEAEHDRLRVTSNPVRYTYRNGLLVSAEPLGRNHHWNHLSSIGILLGIRL